MSELEVTYREVYDLRNVCIVKGVNGEFRLAEFWPVMLPPFGTSDDSTAEASISLADAPFPGLYRCPQCLCVCTDEFGGSPDPRCDDCVVADTESDTWATT